MVGGVVHRLIRASLRKAVRTGLRNSRPPSRGKRERPEASGGYGRGAKLELFILIPVGLRDYVKQRNAEKGQDG